MKVKLLHMTASSKLGPNSVIMHTIEKNPKIFMRFKTVLELFRNVLMLLNPIHWPASIFVHTNIFTDALSCSNQPVRPGSLPELKFGKLEVLRSF